MLLPFEKALKTVLAKARQLPTERVNLARALNRVLAADVSADCAMPPHDNSAMDGFACRAADVVDLDKPLRVVETIAAGQMPRKTIGPGQCSRIMTGAPIPRGADTVVMFENTVVDKKNGTVRVTVQSDNPNIRRRGEDIRKGDIVLCKGTLLSPAHIAVLAATGNAELRVAKQPRVGIIATGNELVEPWQKPRGAEIRNSNGWQLAAQIEAAGCLPIRFGITKDTPAALDRVLKKALATSDVVLLSGGVSMGDFDFVPQVFRNNRIRLLFEKVAVKPGKPTVFGIRGCTRESKRVFGLPGNPVSTFIIFEMLVKPFLFRMAGHDYRRPAITCKLAGTVTRLDASRLEFRPVRFRGDGSVGAPEYHGSAHIHAYTHADAVMTIPIGVRSIAAGSMIPVLPLRW